MFVVDANVLVYAASKDVPEHAKCRALVEACHRQRSAWFLTWPIVYEFLRVTTHTRVLRHPWPVADSWRFIEALLASPALSMLVPTSRHAGLAAEVFAEIPRLAGAVMHDAHTAVLMREHGIRRLYTRDVDFHRFRFLEVVDPLA